jgi:hypothetical protein
MVIELALLVAVVAAMGATIVKVYEWRQDVLYGPYLGRDGGSRRPIQHDCEDDKCRMRSAT